MESKFPLQVGDVLLYGPVGLFGWLIRLKTWHPIAHCEVYWGDGRSVASRDGEGVAIYPLRTEQLIQVLRPTSFDLAGASKYVEGMKGTPYGWGDLLNFVGIDVDSKGIICSAFVTEVLRAAGVNVFNDEKANDIAPFQFRTSELLKNVAFSS